MKTIILCAGPNGRAVVIGKTSKDPVPGKPVSLSCARMLLRWDALCGGLFGLAANGPAGDTRITAAVEKTVAMEWKQFLVVSTVASKAIDAWPVFKAR